MTPPRPIDYVIAAMAAAALALSLSANVWIFELQGNIIDVLRMIRDLTDVLTALAGRAA